MAKFKMVQIIMKKLTIFKVKMVKVTMSK